MKRPLRKTNSSPAPHPGAGADENLVRQDAENAVATAKSGPSQPLPPSLQRKFESSLGVSLDHVRLHENGPSARAAEALSARAYADGSDIHFASGQFRPATPTGELLLAHEVAHTVQQAGQKLLKLQVGSVDNELEREADAAATAMVASNPLHESGEHPVGRPLGILRSTGWQDATPGSHNAGIEKTGAMLRIPLDGLTTLTKSNDQDIAAAPARAPTSLHPREGTSNRAIVCLRQDLSSTEVQVLLHLHGHNIGYRSRASANASAAGGTVRDVSVDHIEQQIEATGSPMIGMLPQGTALSDFSPSTGTGKGFDATAFITEVLDRLVAENLIATRPKVTGVIVSAHSGGSHAISEMMASEVAPPLGTGRLPALTIREIALFDAINGSVEAKRVSDWVTRHLNGDLLALQDLGIASGIVTPSQREYLNNSVLFRAYYTAGGYITAHVALQKHIDAWFATHVIDLGGVGSPQYITLYDHYKTIPVGTSNHDAIVGLNSTLLDALLAVPSSTGVVRGFPGGPGIANQRSEEPARSASAPVQRQSVLLRKPVQHGTIGLNPAHAKMRTVESRQGFRGHAHTPTLGTITSGHSQPSRTIRRETQITPVRANEAGASLDYGLTREYNDFIIFAPEEIWGFSRDGIEALTNVKVHIFFCAGSAKTDLLLHGLRGASNQSDWITIGVPGIVNRKGESIPNPITDAKVALCLRAVGVSNQPTLLRLTGHSRGCDGLRKTIVENLVHTHIDRVVFLDEGVEHSPDGSIRINRIHDIVSAGISAGNIYSYEPTVKSKNTRTGESAMIPGVTYFDLSEPDMASIGVVRIIEDGMAIDSSKRDAVRSRADIAALVASLALPSRGSFSTHASTPSRINIFEFCKEKRAVIRNIYTNRLVLARFIFEQNLTGYNLDFTPWLAHEFFVAEFAHELTE